MASALRKAMSRCILVRYFSSISDVVLSGFRPSYCALKYTNELWFSHKCDEHNESRSLGTLPVDMKPERLCWEGSSSSHDVLLRKLDLALTNHELDEAWDTYKDFTRLYSFPHHSVVNRLVTELSYSSDSRWLRKACSLVVSIQKEKFGLLRPDLMAKLALSLARAQMPMLAATVLRLMLLKRTLPKSNVLDMIFFHLVKTKTGTILASNVLIEICRVSHQLSSNKPKPDTMIFNLVLDACARFGLSVKGQDTIDLMAQVGVAADAQTITSISLIYGMNGMRDGLKKFKELIDKVLTPNLMCHYRQFYDCLLSLHFKFDDIDAASELILDMHRPLVTDHRTGPEKPCLVPLGPNHLKEGSTLRVLPRLLHQETVLDVGQNHRFVTCKSSSLVLTKKALAKLMLLYKRSGRVSELSKLLCAVHKASPCSTRDVFDACISLRWLETAHDILDDLEGEGYPLGTTSYTSLSEAYRDMNMFREADLVLKQSRISKNAIEHEGVSASKSDLTELISEEIKEEEKEAPSAVYKFNSSLDYFMKARMIGDTKTTYRKMQKMKIEPTVSTFIILVRGYSAMAMYREITFLWGDMKRHMEKGVKLEDNDLFELLLLSFLRGGYFERVMELIGRLKEKVYLDKWTYRYEFLKLHKDVYRHTKVFDAKNEVQKKRIGYVEEFKKWAGVG